VRFPFAVLVIIGLFSPLCHSQKAPANFPPRVDGPPPLLPSGCPAAFVANAEMLSGSKAYLFMSRDIEALDLGHTASQQLREAVTTSQDAQVSFTQSLTSTLTGLTDTQNNYLCASFLLGSEKGGDENRRIIRRTLITVYNRMALGTWQIRSELQKAAESHTETQGNDQVKFAEKLASILDDRKEAGGDLVNAITMSAMVFVYAGDPKVDKADTVDMTCSERQILLDKLQPLAKATAVDEFTRAATLYETFFNSHKCRS
jgi:hypothetical protein